jgi:5,5'-dehydrodivanillate O-demethylase
VELGQTYKGRHFSDRVPTRYDFDLFEHGIMNVVKTDEARRWARPTLFPNMNSFQTLFMYRVPMDETHTLHITYNTYALPEGETAQQDTVPYYMIPDPIDGAGRPIWAELDNNGGQDIAAWAAQGEIVDRTQEKLGESDRGVIMLRELFKRQLSIVEDGGVPMNVWRDPAENVRINVPPRDGSPFEWPGVQGGYMGRVNASWVYSPIVTEQLAKHRPEALSRPVY